MGDWEGATMQHWEYQTIRRERWLAGGAAMQPMAAWKPSDDDMKQALQRLGSEGWELVNVVPYVGVHGSTATTEEVWIFKRPAG